MQHASNRHASKVSSRRDSSWMPAGRSAVQWVDERGSVVRLLASSSTTRRTAPHPGPGIAPSLSGRIA